MLACNKSVEWLLHYVYIVGDGESGNDLMLSLVCISKGVGQELSLQGFRCHNDGHLSVEGGQMLIWFVASIELSL